MGASVRQRDTGKREASYLSISLDLLVLINIIDQLSSQQVIINIAAAIYLSLLTSYVLS
jgi:hypothetical protein